MLIVFSAKCHPYRRFAKLNYESGQSICEAALNALTSLSSDRDDGALPFIVCLPLWGLRLVQSGLATAFWNVCRWRH